MTPTIHYDMPPAEYHKDPALAPSLSSGVASILLRESPLKAWFSHPRLNPDYRETHDDKFDLGTAAHAILLEGADSRIVVVEADDWRTKTAKEQREEARACGKTALLGRHHAAVMAMVEAARAFIGASEIAEQWAAARSEVTAIWKESDVWLRCRFDRLTEDRRVAIDYKTTENVEPDQFSRQMIRMGYHWQAAFYQRGQRAIGAHEPQFVFLAQSVTPPHECSLHACDPALREISDADIEQAVQTWRECMKRQQWPSYGGRIHWAMPTSWQIAAHEERVNAT